MNGSETITSTRIVAVLVCGIIILFSVCMNYRENAGMSIGTDLMLLSAVMIFAAASVMFRLEQS
jgi:hypothetical protein